MPKRKLAYYYDTESCTYHRAKVTTKVIMRRMGIMLGLFVAVTFVTVRVFNTFFIDSKTAVLIQEQDTLKAKLAVINDQLDGYEDRLSNLFNKDNEFYLPIVGEAQISQAHWQYGQGGSPLFDPNRNDIPAQIFIRLSKLQHQTGVLQKSLEEVQVRMGEKEEDLKNVPSILPVSGTLISGFGNRRHPVTGGIKFHEGLDFACETGTALYATGDGRVEDSGFLESGYGLHVNIDHQNGYKTKYAHMSKSLVTAGQEIKRGQLIGYSGNTGLSSGPHLHYEIMYQGVKIDPIDFFYLDLSPQEYRRLKLDPGKVTKEAVKKKLDAPAMD